MSRSFQTSPFRSTHLHAHSGPEFQQTYIIPGDHADGGSISILVSTFATTQTYATKTFLVWRSSSRCMCSRTLHSNWWVCPRLQWKLQMVFRKKNRTLILSTSRLTWIQISRNRSPAWRHRHNWEFYMWPHAISMLQECRFNCPPGVTTLAQKLLPTNFFARANLFAISWRISAYFQLCQALKWTFIMSQARTIKKLTTFLVSMLRQIAQLDSIYKTEYDFLFQLFGPTDLHQRLFLKIPRFPGSCLQHDNPFLLLEITHFHWGNCWRMISPDNSIWVKTIIRWNGPKQAAWVLTKQDTIIPARENEWHKARVSGTFGLSLLL